MPAPSRPTTTALVAAAVLGVAFAWLCLLPPPHLMGDATRDLLFARDLAEGRALHGAGASAAFGQFVQGTSWVDLLALGWRMGLRADGLARLAYALQAVAVVLAVLGLGRLLDRPVHDRASLTGAALLLAALPWLTEAPCLWQPLLMPLPAVLAHLALWRLVLDGRALDAILLGLFVAWAIDVHIVAILLVAPAVLAVAVASARPALAMLGAALAGLGLLYWSSPAMLLANVAQTREHGAVGPAALVLAGVATVGLLSRRWFAAQSERRRLLVVALAELLAIVGLAGASLLPHTPDLNPRYLLPFAPSVVLLTALAVPRTRPRVGTAALPLALALLLAIPVRERLRAHEGSADLPQRPEWTLAELDALARVTADHGYDWPALAEHLQAPLRQATLAGFAAFETPAAKLVPPADEDLLLLALPTDSAAEIERWLGPERVLARMPTAGGTALLVRMPARVQRRDLEVQLVGEGLEGTSGQWQPVVLLPPPHRAAQLVERSYPHAYRTDGERLRFFFGEGAVRWRLPFNAGPRRVVSLLPSAAQPSCQWRVTGVVVDDRALLDAPAASAWLPDGRAGWLELARDVGAKDGADDCPGVADDGTLPPPTVETAPDEVPLRALLGLEEPLEQPLTSP